MKLGEKQELFARLFVDHCEWLHAKNYQIRFGDLWAREGHRPFSNHYVKLAGDINLFYGGAFLKKSSDHLESGLRWEGRHELCRWGGNWDKDDHPGEPGEDDGNHYSLIHNGRM